MTGRTPTVIKNFLKKRHVTKETAPLLGLPKDNLSLVKFTKSPEWSVLQYQLDKKELLFFLKKFNKFTSQFGEDVTATEETQVTQLIKFEILMNRVLRAMKSTKTDIIRISRAISAFNKANEGKDLSDTQLDYITKMEDRLAGAKAAQSAKSSEYVKLQQEHNSLMKALKATRDQRLEKIESATKDFMGLIKALEDSEFRDTEGRQLELVKKAVALEEQKLMSPIVYPDGNVDIPLLCAKSNFDKKVED